MAAKQEPEKIPPEQRDFIAEAAALVLGARVASLATVFEGQPYVSLVTPALLPDGAPLLLFSDLSAHTAHLRANPASSLMLTGQAASENPQTAPRVSLIGRAAPTEQAQAKAWFLRVHPYAALYADFADFNFWRFEILKAQYVGGFAAAASLDVAALQRRIIALMKASGG